MEPILEQLWEGGQSQRQLPLQDSSVELTNVFVCLGGGLECWSLWGQGEQHRPCMKQSGGDQKIFNLFFDTYFDQLGIKVRLVGHGINQLGGEGEKPRARRGATSWDQLGTISNLLRLVGHPFSPLLRSHLFNLECSNTPDKKDEIGKKGWKFVFVFL